MNRALFLDRDGIFNKLVYFDDSPHSPRNWQEVVHYPLHGLSDFRALGFNLILVTNQPDIERGFYSREFVDEVNAHYQLTHSLNAVYVCSFKSPDHPWKKPNPGMFLQAAQDHDLDLSRSFHLGDTSNDLEAARRCGITPILWDRPYNRSLRCENRVSSLAQVVAVLLH